MKQAQQRIGFLVLTGLLCAALGYWAGTTTQHAITQSSDTASVPESATEVVQLPPGSLPPTVVALPEKDSDSPPGPLLTLWESTANTPWSVRATPLTPVDWHVTGVVRRGKQTQIIVQFDNDPAPHMLKIGDSLPGGGVLVWVKSDAIGILTPDRQRLRLPLFERDSATQSPSNSPTSTRK